MIKQLKNINEAELDSVVCRHLTMSKFMNMLSYSAIWFPKLKVLQDKFEGRMPKVAKSEAIKSHQKWKKMFAPELHHQFDEMASRSEQDGRDLLVVNCWYLGEPNSKQMWSQYSGDAGIAIKTTIRKLSQFVYAWPEYSHVGKVEYVDFSSHEMSLYEAAQGCERAFLKDKAYSAEEEVRIVSMAFKHPRCVDMDGEPYTTERCSGKNMNNFENPGLYIGINFSSLVDSIVVSPNAPEWIEKTIAKILRLSDLNIPIEKFKETKRVIS